MIARLVLAVILLLPSGLLADSSALILTSVGGSPEHDERFKGWSEGTRKVLVENLGFSTDRVIALTGKATAEDIRNAFAQLKGQLKPADTFFLFFIGHGSFAEDYKFNITGPDLTAPDYNRLIGALAVGKTVIINGTSASGGSMETFAAKNRVVVTATRSGGEGNETIFYGHFLEALQKPEADEDKDQKVSVWEAFKYANAAVERFFKEQGRLATEHAQISDNGADKTGATLKDPPLLARSTSFRVDRQVTVSDPKLQALLDAKRDLEQKIESLRLDKSSLSEADYDKQMESLLVDLATKNQQIREQEKK